MNYRRLDSFLLLAILAAVGGLNWQAYSMRERVSGQIAGANDRLSADIAERSELPSNDIAESSEQLSGEIEE